MNDNQFATTMMMILGVLVAFTIFIMVIANVLIPDTDYSEDNLVQENIEQRINPVGQLAIAGMTPVNASEGDTGSTETPSDAGASKSAADLYTCLLYTSDAADE